MNATDDGRVETSVGGNVVDVLPAAREEMGILAAADDGAHILAAHQDAKIFPRGHTILPRAPGRQARGRYARDRVRRDVATQERAALPMNQSYGESASWLKDPAGVR
jgi:hypothetical protein